MRPPIFAGHLLIMAFTNKPHVSLTMDQLSPAATLKVAKRIKARNKNADLDDLIAIFSKVRIGDEELTSIVEEERAKLYAREKARHGRRLPAAGRLTSTC